MAALPDVPDVLRISLKMSYGEDSDVINRFFVRYSGTAPSSAQLDTLADDIGDDWASDMASECANTVELVEVDVQDLSSASGASGTAGRTDAGAKSGSPLPASAAVLVRFAIARRYRGGKPRAYVPFGDSSDLQDNQTWKTASQTAFLAAWEAFIGDVIAHTWSGATISDHVNVSYFHGFTNFTFPSGRVRAIPTPRATPVVDTVASYSINPHVASQRRRNLTP